MLKNLYPDIYVNSILDIPLEQLREVPIKAFILDLDNTLTYWNSNIIHHDVRDWFKKIEAAGFKACILSNNGESRVLKVASSLNIPFIHRAGKPNPRSFLRAVEVMGVALPETAVIGDQIFTDILGGNSAGLFTILVVPLDRREFIGTKISRFAERFVLSKIKKQVQVINYKR